MHVSREELIRWARAGSIGDRVGKAHIAECDACRLLWELFLSFAGAADAPLASAPSAWVERACAMARSSRTRSVLESIKAKLVFDSWQAFAPAGLRGAEDREARRLLWEAGEWRLDLRAENGKDGWEMVAQVQRQGEGVAGVALACGTQKVHTDRSGMAVWSTRRPPRKISLDTQDGVLTCGEVAWSRPKRN